MRQVLRHPFFWRNDRKLAFLKEASDRIEVENPNSRFVLSFEAIAGHRVLCGERWTRALPDRLLENLGRYRRYDGIFIWNLCVYVFAIAVNQVANQGLFQQRIV